MFEDVLRAFYSYWPISYHVAAFLALLYVFFDQERAEIPIERTFPAVALLILFFALANITLYVMAPNFADYGEVSIAVLAGNLKIGAPVYSDWASGPFLVGSNYGPLSFLIEAATQKLDGNVFGSKLPGVLAFATGFTALYLALRALHLSLRECLAPLAFAVAIYSSTYDTWFYNRPDAALIAVVALACLVDARMTELRKFMALVVLAGLAVNLKLFGPIYFMPLIIASLTVERRATDILWKAVLGIALFLVVAGAPFLIHSFSVEIYLKGLALTAFQGSRVVNEVRVPDLNSVAQSIVFAGAIGAPLVLALTRFEGRCVPIITIGLSALIVAILSGKPGGGPWYMLPFAPLAIYFAERAVSFHGADVLNLWRSRFVCLTMIVALAFAPVWAYAFVGETRSLRSLANEREKQEEVQWLFRKFPEAEMGDGVGPIESDFFFRAQKAYLGLATHFDYPSYEDQRKSSVSARTIDRLISNCAVAHWIFPKEATPWGGRFYDDATRQLFLHNYEASAETSDFELWSCRRQPVFSKSDIVWSLW